MAFFDVNKERVKEEYVTLCLLFDDIIHYDTDFSDGSFARVYEEKYENAVQIIKNDIHTDIDIKNSKAKKIFIPNFDGAKEVEPGIYQVTPEVKSN